MIDVCLLGTGGTMPLPQRALTALCVRCCGKSLLVDCGEGTQVQLRRAGLSMHDIDAILITHLHADHISGLPGLLLSMAKSERKERVMMIVPPGGTFVVRSLCVISANLPFEVAVTELRSAHEEFTLAGLRVTAQLADHSVTCYAYSFALPRPGRFNPQKASLLGVDVKDWKTLQRGESITAGGKKITPDMVIGAPRKGLKLAYCTDTRPTAELVALAKNADLLVCEGMYAEEDKLPMAKKKKHMLFSEAARLAAKAGARELWLTHFSPSLDNPAQYESCVRVLFEHTIIPEDLQKTELNFEK